MASDLRSSADSAPLPAATASVRTSCSASPTCDSVASASSSVPCANPWLRAYCSVSERACSVVSALAAAIGSSDGASTRLLVEICSWVLDSSDILREIASDPRV